MLGMVFTELVEMVEERFSPETADRMLDAAQAAGGGAYTTLGHYPFEQMHLMVDRLSQLTGEPAPQLVRSFGHHLLDRFAQGYPGHFQRHPRLFDFLAAIDGDIHVEVHRLYADTTLPRFDVLSRDERAMTLRYRSPRQMEMLALGLMERLAEHCGEAVSIEMQACEGGCLFHVRRQD